MSTLGYIFGTSHNSAIKSISTKPLWVTTRDAVIVTALTVVATLLVMAIYWWATDQSVSGTDYFNMAVQTIVTSMAAQYLYEYSGVNNMIAESSLRYAKGSTLSKYSSRREAVAYKCLYDILQSRKYDETTVRNNFKHLLLLVSDPATVGGVVDYANGVVGRDVLLHKHPDAAPLLTLPHETQLILESLADRITSAIAYDICVGGLAQYHSEKVSGIVDRTRELLTDLPEEQLKAGELRGQKIMNIINTVNTVNSV